MGLFDRLSRVVRANLNDLVSKAEDPEKVLEQTINDMTEDLIQVRQAVARAIAEQKRTEQRYNLDLSEASKWEQRAKLALSKGDESLAREALVRKKTHTDTSVTLKQQLEQQNGQVNTLKRNLVALESKISEAKTKKNMLIARSKAAKANVEIQQTLSGINTSGSMAAFERMESKVLDMEARSQAIGELGNTGIEEQFARLESGSGVDDELAMLKAQIGGISEPQKLPEAYNAQSSRKDLAVDAELEDLRKQLDNL
ncbi:MAG: PspA/IM30 family protein [cyanobacterium endosymbiont of Rhopalodia sterrenbergii]